MSLPRELDRLGDLFITIPSGGDARARALPSFYWEGQGRAPDGPHRSLAIPVGVANTLPVTGSALGLGSSLVSALHDTTSITDSFTSHHKSSGSSTPPRGDSTPSFDDHEVDVTGEKRENG